MNKPASILLKTLLIIASALVILFAVGLGAFHLNIRAKELPVESAKDFIQLEPGDTVLHAFTDTRWLESAVAVDIRPARGGHGGALGIFSRAQPHLRPRPLSAGILARIRS